MEEDMPPEDMPPRYRKPKFSRGDRLLLAELFLPVEEQLFPTPGKRPNLRRKTASWAAILRRFNQKASYPREIEDLKKKARELRQKEREWLRTVQAGIDSAKAMVAASKNVVDVPNVFLPPPVPNPFVFSPLLPQGDQDMNSIMEVPLAQPLDFTGSAVEQALTGRAGFAGGLRPPPIEPSFETAGNTALLHKILQRVDDMQENFRGMVSEVQDLAFTHHEEILYKLESISFNQDIMLSNQEKILSAFEWIAQALVPQAPPP
ncbi:uncharacterized protein LOC115456834 [Microcaecilia unicolor]|uniref:Uncharacterized protein LOC115456834 n=1 Tax=Microcaecilia unicolor TaxID=1415580 RepID=A0A6P7WUT2_9AMPH|nr:uncharacterized protein LOC115456834 [Microcaecilia unicolor]